MDKLRFKEHNDVVIELEILRSEREGILRLREALMSPPSPQNDGMPRGDKPYHDSMAEGVCGLVDRTNKLDDRIKELIKINIDIIEQIEDFIELLDNPCDRNIMRLRYIHRKKWEDIAEELHYDERHVRRLHDKIINLNKTCP